MTYLQILETPQLRDPVLVAAFTGWNDASEVATFSARLLVQQWAAAKVAEIDPEEFYDFSETRPMVKIAGRFQRRITWPSNEFFAYANPLGERDFVVLTGVEPQLRWRTFTEVVVGYARQLGVKTLVTLGGLVADVPHTVPVKLSGTSNTARVAQRLRKIGVEPTRYEGPTGIVGVLNAGCAAAGITTASIWGSVPDYLSAVPNVKVAAAMLDRLDSLLGLGLDLTEIRLVESQFERQVTEALADNPEVQAYVHELEERERAGHSERQVEQRPGAESLPSSDAIISELEDFLRRRQRGQGGGQNP